MRGRRGGPSRTMFIGLEGTRNPHIDCTFANGAEACSPGCIAVAVMSRAGDAELGDEDFDALVVMARENIAS